jgi:hypothetical protein
MGEAQSIPIVDSVAATPCGAFDNAFQDLEPARAVFGGSEVAPIAF